MTVQIFLSAFPFDQPETPRSLYDHAPVFRVRDRRGDWVAKRTGLVHSDGEAIGAWLHSLRRAGVDVVAPVSQMSPNPRRLEDGKEWVVYPFVAGHRYGAAEDEILAAGSLLGQMHAAATPEARALVTYRVPMVRPPHWVARHLAAAAQPMRDFGVSTRAVDERAASRLATAKAIRGLPLAGCSFDFKASNLVFGPAPTLVDPDHAARIPRLYDLAVALLLFHCDLPSAPARLWTRREWLTFLRGYRKHVTFTDHEIASWGAVLDLAWLDQGAWLLGNWPKGWADEKEGAYLADLAIADLDQFSI